VGQKYWIVVKKNDEAEAARKAYKINLSSMGGKDLN